MQHIQDLDLGGIPRGTISTRWLTIVSNSFGEPVSVPILIARGRYDGPTLGLTAALHGNELNGIPVIQRLFRELDTAQMHGTVIGALVLNVPGLLLRQRQFNDGIDLNRIAPGRPDGNLSEVYMYRLIEKLLPHFDYLVDLHTASFGRINSWYIRANMESAATARMALLQNPDIILNNRANDGTFRGAASAQSIAAITLELRDPHVFQKDVIEDALVGIRNVLYDLDIQQGELVCRVAETVLCDDSYWIYTQEGGILSVKPDICDWIKEKQTMAELRDIFGERGAQYTAPEDGVVIGKSVDPLAQTGSRILHLGIHPEWMPCNVS